MFSTLRQLLGLPMVFSHKGTQAIPESGVPVALCGVLLDPA